MRELPVGLPSELVPLSWLIGVWEGSGVLEYKIGDESVSRTFGHRLSFSHDGLPHLNYSSYTWLEPEEPADTESTGSEATDAASPDARPASSSDAAPDFGTEVDSDGKTPLVTETGYWRLSRTQGDGDPGPGMLPPQGDRPFTSAAAVETLRNRDGGFDIEVSLVHPGGVVELYLGQVKGPRIDLATDAVLRTAGAKPYVAATRLYGLVDNHLLWAWDIAALGQDLRTHASGRLARVE
ncbi:FABP family protein [Cryobacterium melibiosiphilum]|uniref:Peroxynitrite isomerase n=1 Tax=Cryobacterium melibiosiphilum TaxID=995039 RepID=A0A3A5MC00_9MICO|nr:FABP family protein [Cryobacterium melibiosiphilum]RJT86153.1 FABP family protein [Cryobacterium melibiosiphilum]